MPTLQNKILESFKELLSDNMDEVEMKELINILNIIIDLAVKEDRGENIDANVNAQSNNIIELF